MKPALVAALLALAAGFAAGVLFQKSRGAAEATSVERPATATAESKPGALADTDDAPAYAAALEEIERLKKLLPDKAARPKAAMSPEEAAAKAAELRARIPLLVAQEDGKALLSLMKELAALGEPGYAGAMEIAEKLRKALEGKDQAWGLTSYAFDKAFGGAMVPVMQWAIGHPDGASEWFRLHSIDTLRWLPDVDSTAVFLDALASEKSVRVAQSMVDHLQGLGDASAIPGLEAAVHAQAGTPHILEDLMDELRDMKSPEAERELQVLAGDPNPAVSAEARLQLLAIHPPVAGVWISDIVPDGQAASVGLKRGDILVSYNGVDIATLGQLREELFKAPADSMVTVLVHRDGQLLPVQVKGRQKIGLDGKPVSPGGK